MSKKSKHPNYDDPTAFSKRFPRIRKIEGKASGMALIGQEELVYKMGKISATVNPPTEERGYFMSVRGKDRYPNWDEIVWLRYNLIPDAAVMSLLLPNLNAYINKEDTGHKFVFTLEQTGWAIDPPPICECGKELVGMGYPVKTRMVFECEVCEESARVIDLATWNEKNGNGALG